MSIIKIETDPSTGDLVLPLSDELMKEVGWKIGDTIRWTEHKDGSWHLTKVNEQLDLFDEKDEAVEIITENLDKYSDKIKKLIREEFDMDESAVEIEATLTPHIDIKGTKINPSPKLAPISPIPLARFSGDVMSVM